MLLRNFTDNRPSARVFPNMLFGKVKFIDSISKMTEASGILIIITIFTEYINDVIQLNALSRLQKYMGKPEKVAIVNSFIYANFNYCPLVWHFSTCESIRKIEKIQKRCLRIVLDDYDSDYNVLLRKSGKVTMQIKRLRILAIEIFKQSVILIQTI